MLALRCQSHSSATIGSLTVAALVCCSSSIRNLPDAAFYQTIGQSPLLVSVVGATLLSFY